MSSVKRQTEIIKETAKELLILCDKPELDNPAWFDVVGTHLKRLRDIHEGSFDLTHDK